MRSINDAVLEMLVNGCSSDEAYAALESEGIPDELIQSWLNSVLPAIWTHCEIDLEDLYCPHCGAKHEDINEWAMKPHKTHLCLHCNKTFEGTIKAVSYPVLTNDYVQSLNKTES